MNSTGAPLAVTGSAIAAPTLASVVARHIEDRVVADGWRVGTMLGSEADLLEQFGVSRAVLREAVRIVEHTGAAEMRRGPGGGLVVSEPNRGAVVTAMGIWFSYVGVTIVEMLEVRQPLLTGAVRLAAVRRTRDDIAVIEAQMDEIERTRTVGPQSLSLLESALTATGTQSGARAVHRVGR